MTDLIVELSKYLMTLLFAFYTYECFSSFRGKLTPEKRAKIFKRQMCPMYLIHLDAFLAIYAVTDDIRMILFYVVQAAFIAVTISSYRLVYGRASGLLINNMCMLLMIGFIMITRLSFDKAIRQFAIAVGGDGVFAHYTGADSESALFAENAVALRSCRDHRSSGGSGVRNHEQRCENINLDCRNIGSAE